MGADYPGAMWLPADPTNYRIANRSRVSIICIHCTDGHERAQPVAEMWQEPHHNSSAHFVVGQQGEVFQSVAIKDVAYHAHAANAYSVGVEHSARTPKELGPNDLGLPPSDELYASSSKLVAWLCSHLAIPPTRVAIVGHAEADPATSHQLCPTGCGWDWSHYMDLVAAEYATVALSV